MSITDRYELTPAAKRIEQRLCSLLKLDEEMLKFEISCAIEAAFIEGYNKAMEDKNNV